MKLYTFLTLLVCLGIPGAAVAGPQPDAARPPVQFSEISRREVTVGDHKMTLIRVRPPALPKAPPPLPAPPAPTAGQIATEERMAKKSFASLNLTATVYLGKQTITELRWRDETGEKEYQAWSNIDFRYLTQLTDFENPTTVYQWFPFVAAYTLADFPAGQKPPIPIGLKLGTKGADYVVNLAAKDLDSQETTLAGLDYLHAYYQLNHAKLKAAYEKRQAENDARERELMLNPPKTPDTTIRFWVPATK
jgi:hypothetical protein